VCVLTRVCNSKVDTGAETLGGCGDIGCSCFRLGVHLAVFREGRAVWLD